MEDAADVRREIHDEVGQQEALAAQAERRINLAEEETVAIRAGIAKLKEEEAELTKGNKAAQLNLRQQSSFAKVS
jgi:hypothetical protein